MSSRSSSLTQHVYRIESTSLPVTKNKIDDLKNVLFQIMSIFTESLLVDLVGIVIAIIAVLYAYIEWNYQTWKRKNIPYIKPKLSFSIKQEVPIGDVVANIVNQAKERGE